MPIKILMPALSPTMTEGNLAKWLKKEGDKIKPGEVIAEIETDKATMEVEAVDEGILGRIVVAAGSENVSVNSLIALLLEEGEEVGILQGDITSPSRGAIATKQSREDKITMPLKGAGNDEIKLYTSVAATSLAGGRFFASPLARRLALIEGVDLSAVRGSGPGGRIVKADIVAAKQIVETKSPENRQVLRNSTEYRLSPNNNIRKIIARRLVESKQTIPHFYLSIECNIDKLINMRLDINSAFEDDKSKKISVNDLVIIAAAKALRDVPEANASWDEAAIKYYNNIDISVAVAIEGGLITPVLRNADQKTVFTLSTEMKSLAKKARENKLTPEEFQGGGFSISNLGMYGIQKFSAIINPPQSCIMAVGEGSKRAVVIGNELKIATIMDITLSCDHRVVDGTIGAKFLAAFKRYIESPVLLVF